MYTHIANISHFIRHIIHSHGIHDLVQVAYDQNLALLGSAGLTPVAERFELRKQQMLGTTCGTRINGLFPEYFTMWIVGHLSLQSFWWNNYRSFFLLGNAIDRKWGTDRISTLRMWNNLTAVLPRMGSSRAVEGSSSAPVVLYQSSASSPPWKPRWSAGPLLPYWYSCCPLSTE